MLILIYYPCLSGPDFPLRQCSTAASRRSTLALDADPRGSVSLSQNIFDATGRMDQFFQLIHHQHVEASTLLANIIDKPRL